MTVPVRGHMRGGSPVRPHTRSAPGKLGTGAVASAISVGVAMSAPPVGGIPPVPGSGLQPTKIEIQAKNKKNNEKDGKDFLNAKVRWRHKGYQVNVREAVGTNCAAHSYGEVHDFFVTHPCSLLSRVVFELRDKHWNVVLVATSRVDMPTTGEASELKTLVDTGGTGNVTELSREKGPYRSVHFEGLGYDSDLDEWTVRNIQVQPVGWWPGVALLNEIRDDVPR